MIHRERPRPPAYIYPADEWRMLETRYYPPYVPATETMFSTANGYLGIRGSFDEGRPVCRSGTFVNGFYESWPIVYGEDAFGFAKTGQTIVRVPDGMVIHLYVDDEPFYLPTAKVVSYERALDMRFATLDRRVIWETPRGKRVLIDSHRLVSLEHRHLAAIQYEVTLLDADAPMVISSHFYIPDGDAADSDDPRRVARFGSRVLHPHVHRERGRRLALGLTTERSDMRLGCATDHEVETDCEVSWASECAENGGKVVFSLDGRRGCPIRLVKYLTYHSSDTAYPPELCDRAERTLDRAVRDGFDSLLVSQRSHMDDFWERSDVQVEGEPEVQQAIRFNLFHVMQATARAEGVGVPAKGLTGDGYEGHYFWDTEIYVLPFLVYTAPRVARNLLMFRYGYLDKARERARQVNQRGALFPWRTISGEEASSYYAAGTAQYHINADIMYALKKYVDVTGDVTILEEGGAEMLIETARLWCDIGFYSARRGGHFCIHSVTGPDEYNTVVDNNTFTNLMARENLSYAVEVVEGIRRDRPALFQELVDRTQLEVSELEQWRRAAEAMYVPFDETEGIHPQDDDFLCKKPWDFENTPRENYPLLLHYHPLVIYRHKVIKQADIVLAMFLLGNEFSLEQKKRNFDYYDPLTTGDSSLSACIQAIVAAEVGYIEKAREYARYAALMDLADVAGNVRDGCHIASMGGTWLALASGFAGLRDHDGRISFRPQLPSTIRGLRLPLAIRCRRLLVDVRREETTYTLVSGPDLAIWHCDEEISLTPEAPSRTLRNPPHGELAALSA